MHTPSTFLEECLCVTWLKDVIIIEDCDNIIFIVTSIYANCKIKLSKTFPLSENLLWIIWKYYFGHTTL